MFDLAILDKNFETVRQIDDFASFIWASRYSKVGDFEIVLPLEQDTLNYVRRGYYIVRRDTREFGIVEQIELGHNEDDNEQVIITGRLGESILSRRVVSMRHDFKPMSIDNILLILITDECISPVDEKRKIPGLRVVVDYGDFEQINLQVTEDNLLTIIEDICETYSIGFWMELSLIDKNYIFTLHIYRGKDRSIEQNTNKPVIFSDDYDNLLTSQYIESDTSLVTDVLVRGEGEGDEVKRVWASRKDNSGLDRYEKFSDRSDIQSGSETFDNKFDEKVTEPGGSFETAVDDRFDTNFPPTFDTGMDDKFDGNFDEYKGKLDDLIENGGSGGGGGTGSRSDSMTYFYFNIYSQKLENTLVYKHHIDSNGVYSIEELDSSIIDTLSIDSTTFFDMNADKVNKQFIVNAYAKFYIGKSPLNFSVNGAILLDVVLKSGEWKASGTEGSYGFTGEATATVHGFSGISDVKSDGGGKTWYTMNFSSGDRSGFLSDTMFNLTLNGFRYSNLL